MTCSKSKILTRSPMKSSSIAFSIASFDERVADQELDRARLALEDVIEPVVPELFQIDLRRRVERISVDFH